MKKQLMMVAWAVAKSSANIHGGKASEYISHGMKVAWKFQKQGILQSKFNEKFGIKKEEVKPSLKGRMTEKQENFITSLLRKKHTDNPVAKAFNVPSLRSTISKQQASDLISELLSA